MAPVCAQIASTLACVIGRIGRLDLHWTVMLARSVTEWNRSHPPHEILQTRWVLSLRAEAASAILFFSVLIIVSIRSITFHATLQIAHSQPDFTFFANEAVIRVIIKKVAVPLEDTCHDLTWSTQIGCSSESVWTVDMCTPQNRWQT